MKFRFKALQRMREPDELDSPTLLASPRGWIATFVVLIIVVAAGIWFFAGKLPITVPAAGLLTHPAGTARLQTPYGGTVRSMLVGSDEDVREGQAVAIVAADGEERVVRSPFTGRVVAADAVAGHVVRPGDELLLVERTDAPGDRLVAMLFVPVDRAMGVVPGKPVELSVSSAPPGAYGLLRGRVHSVSPYPVLPEQAADLVGGEQVARGYLDDAPARLVIVDLERDPATPSGYAWSTKKGPPVGLQSQVSVGGAIGLGSQTLFDLLLGR
ncbi:MAG: HlyD family efflux transporter periplasmic adaptor subunit [Nonomuraea sp.]|nr:HlyD family efflux transporter periplasmic adaptor subunit [Nonomuraea sp.]NUP69178.1 HlyD family efflux transporter periplasmic adaptor subunit [Nonomuraea sp.]NUP77047.1 HlyD family efflux transporter periplasmic adaptor subunit [Nonomuraea sp.]NUS08424.1 HlyD family efflux transporter periplasmic adaptor subunit [Nonomuraea sp.]NUT09633.1 HlyD family efflux transporter periplasmic adaptor subunit [Nonomuraea sp.]